MRKRRSLVRRLIAWSIVCVGLLLLGGFVGHRVTPPTTVAGPTLTLSDLELPTEAPNADVGDDVVVMPDVLGLEMDVVRRVLQDSGISTEPETTEQPAAGPAGQVISQSPGPGEEVDGPATLTLSAEALMPDLVGQPLNEARREVEALRVVTQVVRQVAPREEPGVVLATDPQGGTSVPEVVVLTVSDPGEAVLITELRSVESSGSCQRRTNPVTVGGELVDTSLSCGFRREGETASVSYNLARRAGAFTTTLGSDDSGGRGEATITIGVDDQVLHTETVRHGEPSTLLLDVADGLRLTLDITFEGEEPLTVVFGDAALLGSAEDLAVLESL